MKKPLQREKNRPSAAKLSQGMILEARISRSDSDGFGITVIEGKEIRVWGAIEAELCKMRIRHSGRYAIYASLLDVIEQSSKRAVENVCKVKGCDGCALLNRNEKEQLEWKKEKISDAFRKYSVKTAQLPDVISSGSRWGYRNSAKLVISGTFSSPIIGIYKRGSHNVIDLESCPLHHPLIEKIIKEVKEGIKKLKIPIYHPESETGILKYLTVKISELTGEASIVFVTAYRSYNELHHLGKLLQKKLPEAVVIAQNVNSSGGNVIFGRNDYYLTAKHRLQVSLGHLKLLLSPRSFYQVNSSAALTLYETAIDFLNLEGNEKILDVYCGVGGIGLFASGRASSVTGIEILEEAVKDAAKNASLNRADNCSFLVGNAEEVLADLRESGEKFDRTLLNPPRTGCSHLALEETAAIASPIIVYVSCNPETLARDIHFLESKGYRLDKIKGVDMFPQTNHVETVARMVK